MMAQSLAWVTSDNVVAPPLAAGVLTPWGILLNPAMGAVLMSVCTIFVVMNEQTPRRERFTSGA